MEIFHYLAIELKDIPIFENETENVNFAEQNGAVFNDFDFRSEELLSSTSKEITFASISNSSVMYDKSDAGTLVPQESVEHVIRVIRVMNPYFILS